MLMKLLHTADLHMDRAFEGLKKLPKLIARQLQHANQKMLENITEVALKNEVDAVIFAGDTFHQSRASIRTQSYFIHALKQLEQANIPVILIFGNHDYYLAERYWFDFPGNVLLFNRETVDTHYFETKNQERIAVSSFSYEHSWVNEDKLIEFPEKERTVDIHIGVYHGDTVRNNGLQNYAPFSFTRMKQKNYDYWALGHIHQPQIVSAQPLIVYPGTPQGHTKKEVAVQGVALVTIGNGHSTVHFEPVAEVSWQRESYSLSSQRSLQEALHYITTIILDNHKKQKQLVLLELHLTDIEQLGEEFDIAYKNEELLHYLQENVLLGSKNTLFIFQLAIKTEATEKKVLISADKELLKQLGETYLQPEIFSDVMKELIQNPIVSNAIKMNDDWRKKSLVRAMNKINEEFVLEEGPL